MRRRDSLTSRIPTFMFYIPRAHFNPNKKNVISIKPLQYQVPSAVRKMGLENPRKELNR